MSATVTDTTTALDISISAKTLESLATPRVAVFNDDGTMSAFYELPEHLPDWAMTLADHAACISRTATYHCASCGAEHDEYRQNQRDLPYAKTCGAALESADATLTTCAAPALRRVVNPGEGVALNARRFEQLSVLEVHDWESKSDDFKRSHQRYYVPGRNYEPTEPGYVRHDLTNMQDYNRFIKTVNAHELQKMRDHREMHRIHWDSERTRMRENVNARIRPEPLLRSLARMIRKRSDQKSAVRYGRALDPHFHAQLIEFNQSNMQAWTDKETGWKDRRAR
jgi:hypothetical protein